MESVKNKEPTILCPYNSAHEIIAHRMQMHLVKCKRNYPDAKIVECMFNSTHRIPEPELKYHLMSCSDRITVDKDVFVAEDVDLNKFPVPKFNISCEENWDEDEHPTYNPEEHCSSNPILRVQKVQSASVRKNFRMEERQRIQQLFFNDNSMKDQQNDNLARRPVTTSAGIAGPSVSLDSKSYTLPKVEPSWGAPETGCSRERKIADVNSYDDLSNSYGKLGISEDNKYPVETTNNVVQPDNWHVVGPSRWRGHGRLYNKK